MANNDEMILKLKKEVAAGKEELKKYPARVTPLTTCNLELYGVKYNFHAGVPTLLLVQLNALQMAAKDLGIGANEIMLGSFSLLDWITDANNFNLHHQRAEKKRKLDALEKQLTSLLSEDKQKEMEIMNLADSLTSLLNTL